MNTPTGLCKGCWRTIDEIIAWSKSSDADKQQVWAQIAQRKTQVVFDNATDQQGKV
jgi:uncharacterized protein